MKRFFQRACRLALRKLLIDREDRAVRRLGERYDQLHEDEAQEVVRIVIDALVPPPA